MRPHWPEYLREAMVVSILYEADGLCDLSTTSGLWGGWTSFQSSTRLTAFATPRAGEGHDAGFPFQSSTRLTAFATDLTVYLADGTTLFQSSTRLTAFATLPKSSEPPPLERVSILYEADGLCDAEAEPRLPRPFAEFQSSTRLTAFATWLAFVVSWANGSFNPLRG